MEQLTFKSLLIQFSVDDILPELKPYKNSRRMVFLNSNMPSIWHQDGKDAHR